jgi:DNA-binding MarR family transcriptional regulator
VTPDERREIAERTRSAVTRLARRMRTERPANALSGNKIGVLGHLYRNGPSNPGAIAAAEHQRPQSLTRVFAELESAGLVRRTQDAMDGRAAVLAVTADGVTALRRDMAHRDAWLAHAFEDLADQEVAALDRAAAVLDRLAER